MSAGILAWSGICCWATRKPDHQQGGFSFRGLSQSNNLSRNYFRWYIPNDTYNVERIDFGKGSNSLVFGEVEPGGMGSVFTKRPQQRNFATVLGQYNSEGAYRAQIDLNRILLPNLAMRFNLVRRQEKTFQDASAYKFDGETLAIVWQPFRHTSIRIEAEQGKWDSTRGWASVRVREQSARGLGFTNSGTYFTSAGTWIIQSTLPAIDRGGTNGSAGGEPSLIDGRYFDVTMRNAAGAPVDTRRVYGLPMHYNLRGSFDNQARPFNALSVTIEQKAGPLNLELAYNHQAQHQDRNDNSFDGPINLDVNGRPYMDSTSDRKRFGTETHAFRGSAAYLWNQVKWTQQLLVASAEYREHGSLNYRLQGRNTRKVLNGTASAIDITNDRGRLRVYLDDPGFYSRAFYDRMQFSDLPVTSTVDMRMLGFFASGTDAADGTAWSRSAAASVFASGKYFGGRLQPLVGVRRDESRLWEYRTSPYLGPFNEAISPPKRKAALPGDHTENLAMNQAANTISAGLTWGLTRDINIYGVYSESFRFQDAVTFDNVRFGPITGVTKEIKSKPAGARASPWSASWIIDYAFSRSSRPALRGVRLGLNGNWRDDYLFGPPNGQEMVGGFSHLMHGYVMRDQKIWGRQVRIRAGVKNIKDLENSYVRKTSFTTLSTGANIYRYSYVMPPQYDLSMSVKF